jgi:glycosyltransferase involved in cell wall biosynthesis
MRFSIVIICHNREELIKHSLLSLNDQDFKDFDVILVDDGSDEPLENVLKDLSLNFPIKIHRNDRMTGYSPARNDALVLAKGEIVIVNDSGMISPPNYLKIYDKLYKENGRNCSISGYTYYLRKNYLPKNYDYHTFINEIKIGKVPIDDCSIRRWYNIVGENDRWKCFIGTNSSFYREDALVVNGYHIKFNGWGPDDIEIAYRLQKLLGRRIFMFYENLNYHIWHPSAPEQKKMESFLYNNKVFSEIHPEVKWSGILPIKHYRKFLQSMNIVLDSKYTKILDEADHT